jgi:F0F1-type ATP synthase assembly protein I
MEKPVEKVVWWKPAVEIFTQISGWIVAPILLSLIIGKKLDSHYSTAPWIFIGLSSFSFLISSFGIVKTIKDYIQKIEQEKNDNDAKSNRN